MNQNNGISVIVFCFNSEKFIERNLRCLNNQIIASDIPCEIIVIDNNSTDKTSMLAESAFRFFNKNFDCRVVKEPRQGLSFAREKGISVAKYETIIFVDDDNFLEKDYLQEAYDFLSSHPDAGVCGSQSIPEYEQQPGEWFEKYKTAIAVGQQSIGIQDITATRKFVWGAGMIFRRSIIQKTFLNGFRFINTDRIGNQLASSGDIELCYAVIASGFRVYYNENLKLIHYISAGRVQWDYIQRILAGYGASTIWLDVFEWFEKGRYLNFSVKKIYGIHHLILLKSILKDTGSFIFTKIAPENDYNKIKKIIIKKARIKQFYKISPADYYSKVNIIKNFYSNCRKDDLS